MRLPRIKPEGGAIYHCVSRVVAGAKILDDSDCEVFCEQMWVLARFCGIEIITFAIMPNHFHILAHVPPRPELKDDELLERLAGLYGKKSVQVRVAQQELDNTGKLSPSLRARWYARLYDISVYIKELKQAFSRYYNRKQDRFGTLWAERFKSNIVEVSNEAVQTVAAYIDLNGVRAGLVTDPKDFRFCGYGQSVGSTRCRERLGLWNYVAGKNWEAKQEEYRTRLLLKSVVSGASWKKAMDPAEIREKLRSGAKLSSAEVLRIRVRYFTDGVFLGSQKFVEEMFCRYRKHWGPKRETGARRMRGADWGLFVLRDLRVHVFG